MHSNRDNELLAILEESDMVTKRQRSDRTLKDYRSAFKCLSGLTPQEYRQVAADSGNPISPSRYRMLKGSYQYHMAQRAAKAARTAIDYRSEDNYDASEIFEDAAHRAMEALRCQQPDYNRERYRNDLPAAHPAPPDTENKTKHSKRPLLRGLKKRHNWQADLIAEMPSQHQLSTAVLVLTGCRLSELEKGVLVEASNGNLEFTIKGSKVTQVSGQRRRKLTINPTHNRIAAELYEALLAGTKNQKIVIDLGVTQRTFYEAHIRAACRTFGHKLGEKLSPYIHRHAFSADLKAADYDRKDIAMALGHTTDKTQEYYGMARQSTGNERGLTKVEATREIKSTQSATEFFLSKKEAEI